jgi:hypothetical protein
VWCRKASVIVAVIGAPLRGARTAVYPDRARHEITRSPEISTVQSGALHGYLDQLGFGEEKISREVAKTPRKRRKKGNGRGGYREGGS